MTDQRFDQTMEIPSIGSSFWLRIIALLIVVATILGITYWLANEYLFSSSFTPVQLSQKEQRKLDKKLDSLSINKTQNKSALEPEPYSEAGASREIYLSEKELNALLANNTDLASKLAIDLADNLASAKLRIPLDPDFPILGGKTLKLSAGMELAIKDGKPRAVLKGVSLWGIPLPNAWLGNMKNIDLMQEFGGAGGFWQAIRDGVEEIEIKNAKLRIKLKE